MTGQPLTDQSLMPFGLHKGTKLANVPASYLIWMHNSITDLRSDLKNYIKDNMDVLKAEVARSVKESRR